MVNIPSFSFDNLFIPQMLTTEPSMDITVLETEAEGERWGGERIDELNIVPALVESTVYRRR